MPGVEALLDAPGQQLSATAVGAFVTCLFGVALTVLFGHQHQGSATLAIHGLSPLMGGLAAFQPQRSRFQVSPS
jgi:hypothetical protein